MWAESAADSIDASTRARIAIDRIAAALPTPELAPPAVCPCLGGREAEKWRVSAHIQLGFGGDSCHDDALEGFPGVGRRRPGAR